MVYVFLNLWPISRNELLQIMKRSVNATIITIGDELLIGQVIDTNSAFMARFLNRAGISVIRKLAVSDNAEEIRAAIDRR